MAFSHHISTFYIRDLLDKVVNTHIGCNIGGIFFNVLAYADDMVLLAPSWSGLQQLLNVLNCAATDVSMTFNTKKTVCMVFAPSNRNRIIANKFPALTLAGTELLYVEQFKYLGHIIDNKLSDSSDIIREIKCMFTRTNILLRRFKHCSAKVKIILFRTYCMCMYRTVEMVWYGIALWKNYTAQVMNRMESC